MGTYHTLDDLDTRDRTLVTDLLREGEEFVVAYRNDGLLGRFFPWFIVTDRRFIRYRKLWWAEYRSDIPFARLSHVRYDTRNFVDVLPALKGEDSHRPAPQAVALGV